MLRKDLGEGSDEGSSTNSHEVPRCCCMPASLSASRALWFPGACALYRLALPVWCPATLQGVAQMAVGAVRSTLVNRQRARVVLRDRTAGVNIGGAALAIGRSDSRHDRAAQRKSADVAAQLCQRNRRPLPPSRAAKTSTSGPFRVFRTSLVCIQFRPPPRPAPKARPGPGPAWPRPTVLVGLCVLTGRRRVGCSRHWSSAQPRATWLRLRSSAHGY